MQKTETRWHVYEEGPSLPSCGKNQEWHLVWVALLAAAPPRLMIVILLVNPQINSKLMITRLQIQYYTFI